MLYSHCMTIPNCITSPSTISEVDTLCLWTGYCTEGLVENVFASAADRAVDKTNGARSRAKHFPPGFLQMPYRLTAEDMPTFPNLPQGLVDAQGRILAKAGWDFQEHKEPFYIWRINCTHVHFVLERGAEGYVLSRFACGVVKRFPTTFAIFLRLNHKTSLALNNTFKLCASAGHKEFVNVHRLSTKQPDNVDADQRWMWVDPIKKPLWRNNGPQ